MMADRNPSIFQIEDEGLLQYLFGWEELGSKTTAM